MKLVRPTDPILTTNALPVEFPNKGLSKTVSDMLRFMNANGGCGLAAPQVGIPWRLFTYRHGIMGVVINPAILSKSAEIVEIREGCLTYAKQIFKTTRHKSISVSYQDLAGNLITKDLDGFLAIIFQHEYDHLEGRLLVHHGIEETPNGG